MKTKAFQKKLSLKKITVADLNPNEMNHIQGGAIATLVSKDGPCPSKYDICQDTNWDLCFQIDFENK